MKLFFNKVKFAENLFASYAHRREYKIKEFVIFANLNYNINLYFYFFFCKKILYYQIIIDDKAIKKKTINL